MTASRKQAAYDRQRKQNDARMVTASLNKDVTPSPKRVTLSRPEYDPSKPWLSGDPAFDRERRNLTWDSWDIYGWEPLSQDVLDVASLCDVDPLELDWHVEAVHGWETHDYQYRAAVVDSVRCILAGGCRADDE